MSKKRVMDIIASPSPNFDDRNQKPDMILIHYTDMLTSQVALDRLGSPHSGVSAHYLIDESGHIYQLVKEEKRAWHAGESFWHGRTGLNDCSIGIELANPGHSHGYVSFPEAQIAALISLCHQIKPRWDIPSSRILGHSDVAPRRKQDPGHLFPWERLALEGLGLWPTSSQDPVSDIGKALSQIGYETISLPDTIKAFQRHFQPHKIDGEPDLETRCLLGGF